MKKDTQPSFFISGSIAFTEVGMINLKGKCAKNMREARVLPNQRHVATSEPVTFNVKQAPRHRPRLYSSTVVSWSINPTPVPTVFSPAVL